MKKMNGLFFGTMLLLVFAALLGNPSIVKAQEKCIPVYVRSHEGIERETLNIDKGDCVVWINWTRGEGIKIIFRDGKKCAEVTKAPVRFKPDFSGCYLTDHLGFGETASLVFAETGRYDYEVEFWRAGDLYGVSGIAKLSGSIVVK